MSPEAGEPKEVPFPSREGIPQRIGEMEDLLESLEGVDAVTVVPGEQGGIDEIHVLTGSDLGAKQIVRNVESALLAELGVKVDHRVISVARSSQEFLQTGSKETFRLPGDEEGDRRLELVGVTLERSKGRGLTCRVELKEDDDCYVGEASGSDHQRTRVEIAGNAVLEALRAATQEDESSDLTLHGIKCIEAFGNEIAVAKVDVRSERSNLSLVGAAQVEGYPEDAAVHAVLHATNRWVTRDGD